MIKLTNMLVIHVYWMVTVLAFSSVSFCLDVDRDLLCDDIVCGDYECPDADDCEHGLVPDVCRCCYTCAKGPGEKCGGMLDLAGTCAKTLFCVPHPKYPQLPGVCAEK